MLRGERVMLDEDIAGLYGVPTKRLNESVRRNRSRFPDDFMFQLNEKEWEILRSQSATSSSWGGRRTTPYAFTENGVAMLSSILNSESAIQVNIAIMRAFTELRKMLASHQDLARKLEAIESRYDSQFKVVFEAIRQLMAPTISTKKKSIGFGGGDS
jgi:phage regulator Rha-like protein